MKAGRRPGRTFLGLVGALAVAAMTLMGRAEGQATSEASASPPEAPPRHGADTATLRLREAVERALDHDPTLGVSREAFAAAGASHRQATAAWWPELRLAGSLTRYQEPMIVSPIHDFAPGETPAFDETLIQGGGYLGWTLFDGGGRRASIRRSRWEASAAEADLDATTQSVIADVTAAYLEVLSRARVLDAHDRRIAALEAELDRVRQLREVGRAAELELLRVEAVLASARSDRVGVASRLGVARRELARLMGAPPSEVERRPPAPLGLADAPLPRRGELSARAVDANPGVEAARRRRTAAEAGLSLARSDRWPELQLLGHWVDHGGIDSDHRLEWATGLHFSLPVFTGGRISEGIARGGAEARAAGERLRLAVTAAERAVDQAVSMTEETEARARSLEIAAARSREVVRIEILRLDTGTGTQTDYLDAEAELLAVEAALAETRHASIRARVELARVLGRLSLDWLDENLEMAP